MVGSYRRAGELRAHGSGRGRRRAGCKTDGSVIATLKQGHGVCAADTAILRGCIILVQSPHYHPPQWRHEQRRAVPSLSPQRARKLGFVAKVPTSWFTALCYKYSCPTRDKVEFQCRAEEEVHTKGCQLGSHRCSLTAGPWPRTGVTQYVTWMLKQILWLRTQIAVGKRDRGQSSPKPWWQWQKSYIARLFFLLLFFVYLKDTFWWAYIYSLTYFFFLCILFYLIGPAKLQLSSFTPLTVSCNSKYSMLSLQSKELNK